MNADPRSLPGALLGRWALRIASIAVLSCPGTIMAGTPTVTTLTLSPSSTASALTAVTLTATVHAGGTPVAGGAVDFYDTFSPGLPIRSVQLTSAGTAEFKSVFAIGAHSLTAKFEARGTYSASTSTAQAITVSPHGNIPSLDTLFANQVQGAYTLTDSLSLHAKAAPTGSVGFISPSNNNASLGSSGLTFQSMSYDTPVLYSTGTADGASSTFGIATGDFDGDGILDLAASNNNSQIVILLGKGDGTFAAGVPYTAGTSPGEVVAVDLNRDGNLDLVCIDNYTGALLVLLGNGDGTFQAAASTPTPASIAYDFALADLNGDGKLDLVLVDPSYTPGFGGGPLVVALGNGDGTFQTPGYLTNTFPDVGSNLAAAADLNGDGIPDLIVTNQGYYGTNTQNLSVLLGKGDGTFADPVDYLLPGAPAGLAVADLNGDGIPDVVVNSDASSQATYVLLGQTGGLLAPAATYPSGSYGGGALIGDFNGDGKLDLAVAISNDFYGIDYFNILPGNGDGTFGTAYSVEAPSGVGVTVAADFDGSGMLSLASATLDSGGGVTLANTTYSGQVAGVLVTGQETAQVNYTPGPSDPYESSSSKVATLYPSQYSVSFSTPPPLTLTAGQAPGTVAVTVYVDGQVLTVRNETVTLTVTGPDEYYQTYSAISSNGIATFSTLPALMKAGNYVYYAGSSSVVLASNASANVTVTAGVTTATALAVVNIFPSPANPGVPAPWPIAAVDKNGNPVATFTGTVTVSSSDPAAVFTPASHTYTASDAGTFTFQIALKTAGTQSLTATSTGLTPVTQSGIAVASAAVGATLSVTPASPVASQTVETLTAKVVNGSSPQYPGTVAFYDSSRHPPLIGTAQLTRAGIAVFKTVLPVGSHSLTATFNGTTTAPAASSARLTYTVNGTQVFETSGLLTSTQNPGFTTLADGAGFFAQPAPTGQVQFIDGNTGNVLGTMAPAPKSVYYEFVVNTYDTRVGTPAYALAAGDINGDGSPDVVAVNSASNDDTVTVFLGNGYGSFTQTQVYTVGHNPTGIALADFNNDGILDLIVTNTGDSTVSVLLGNGDGTFGLPITAATGPSPTAVVVADINQDGNLDALITNSGSNTVSILYGNGDGTFKSQSTLTVGNAPNGIAIADFNEDGIPDLAVTSLKDNAISVLIGMGGNRFQTPVAIATEAGTSAIAAGDFGNGHQDIVVTLPSTNSADSFLGAGDGTFQEGDGLVGGSGQANPTSIAIGDFNQDGILDVAVGFSGATKSGVLTSFGSAGGYLQNVQSQAFGQSVLGLVSGDFLNDGLPTLVASNTTIPSQYNGETGELAISLLEDTQGYSLTLTPVNIPDAVAHSVYAKYVPGPNDAYMTSYSNSVLVNGSLLQTVFFQPNLPTSAVAGTLPGGQVTVEVEADGIVQTAYNGPVQLTVVGLTLSYTQTCTINAVNGIADFTSVIAPPTLAGLYVYNIAIPNTAAKNSSYDIDVTPAAATQLVLSNPYIAPAVAGISGVVGVSIEDQYGNPTPGFAGTVTLTTSDAAAVLSPSTHTFTSADNGYAPFAVTFKTLGTQSITATTTGLTTNTGKQSNIAVKSPSLGTTTALALSASGSVAAGTAETLTATVKDNSSNAVTQGTVDFFDTAATPHLIAKAELKSGGIATASLILPVGAHTLTASLEVENAYASSTSPAVALTVAPAQNYVTQTALTASGSPTGYTLNANILAYGKAALAATTVTLKDTGNGNATLGIAPLGTSAYGLQPQVVYPTGSYPSSVSIADFNGDGKPDLIVANSADNTVTVQFGNGNGTFGPATVIFTYTGYTQQVLAGDFNGDGKQDFALLNENGSVFIALGNGDGTFATPKQAMAPPDGDALSYNFVPFAMVAADFNRDGRPDLAITDALDSTVLVLLGYGDGTFQAPVVYAGETKPQGIAAADVNRDGKADLIVANSGGNTVSVLLGNGDGTFQKQVTYAVGSFPIGVLAADLNGDGAPDLAVVNFDDDTVSVLLNNGSGAFGAQTVYAVGSGPLTLIAADLNADGVPDLAVANDFAATLSILNGKGDGAFAAQTTVATGGFPNSIAAGDLTGGGLNSLAVVNENDSTVSILLAAQTNSATLSNVALSGASVHNVDALYVPAAADPYALSTSNVVALQGSGLGPAATTTAVASSSNPARAGSAVDFTATVASPIGVLATGTVKFYDGTTLLGSVSLGTNRQAEYEALSLTLGTHNITAVYSGDTNFAASTSPVLLQVASGTDSTSLSLLSSLNPASGGASVTFTALLAPSLTLPAPPTGSVTFLDGSTVLGTVTLASNGSAALTIFTLSAGNHTISASYSGDANYSGSTSATITEVINLSPCDVNQDGKLTAADVQRMINEALGSAPPANDLNRDGKVNAVDVQIDINAVLGLGCSAS